MKKLLSLIVAAAMLLGIIPTALAAEEVASLKGKEYGTDYISLYKQFGKAVTIADVTEDEATGLCFIERDGVEYELGLDFLSMAMVYNTAPAGKFTTEKDAFAEWWRLYIQRWNYLLPEIPLYSNEYYELYNAQIKGVEEYPTNPYWGPTSALIDWTSEKEDNSIILGNDTDLSGKFRMADFGASTAGAADNDVSKLIHGLETVVINKEGMFQWNDTVVKSHEESLNADGSKTFTITLHDDLAFSDGSPIKAKNYIVHSMVFSSPVAAEAAGKDHMAGMYIKGFKEFNAYDGANAPQASKKFAGLRLLGDYRFSITIAPDYIPYFYDISYAKMTPEFSPMWIGAADIMDDGDGVYFTDDFYSKGGDGKYEKAALIRETSLNTDCKYPYSGPYFVEAYDRSDSSAVMKINPHFKGNYEGAQPSIEKVVYKKMLAKTQLQDLEAGMLDCVSAITGGDETNEAIALADNSNGRYVYTYYNRAGYGKLSFRADYGPARFYEVRQAVAYCMDRARFAKDFTGGYGGVVDGPYYPESWMYKTAVAHGMALDSYAASVDSAIEVLTEGGWIYDKDGNEYTEGVRYKKIPERMASENDINYRSKDGAYATTKVGGDYYMPLVINWFATADDNFTEQMLTGFVANENLTAAGFDIQYTLGDFQTLLDEFYQAAVYGYYSGKPLYCAFNLATIFYDDSYNYAYAFTVDPSMYDSYSKCYIKDDADIFWLK